MNNCTIPEKYRPLLGLYDTQVAIAMTKRVFEDTLSGALHLRRVSAPLLLDAATGLNDDLNGVERPVEFDIRATAPMPRWCILWPNGNARRCTAMVLMWAAELSRI